MTLNLIDESLRRGYEVDLVLCRETGALLGRVPAGARVIVLRRASQLRARRTALAAARSYWRELLLPVLLPRLGAHAISALPDLVSYLEREKPAQLIAAKTHTNLAAIWARALSGVSLRVVAGERTNLTSEVAGANGRKWRWRHVAPLLGRAYRDADLLYAVSSGTADDLAQQIGLERERIETIYNPVVTDALRAAAAEPVTHPWLAPGAPPVVLGVGRLEAQKDFSTLIRAFAEVRAAIDSRLLILGEGSERSKLSDLVRREGLEAYVELHGFATNPSAFMARAGVFVLSSAYEGLGNVLIEAMHAGCPVVSTDCPSGPSEILEGGRHGPLVPVGDATALALAIVQQLKKPRQSDVLRARAEEFHVGATLDRILGTSR
jgi:glycosyltransferase involved in cell wall biosynthesis